jgi:hypothetical protein
VALESGVMRPRRSPRREVELVTRVSHDALADEPTLALV